MYFAEFYVDKNGNLVEPYAAAIAPSDKLTFSETVGYDSPAEKTVKVTNTGVNDLYAAYNLSGTSPSAFVLTTPGAMSGAVASGNSIDLKVKAAVGLEAGTYSAVLDVFVSTDSAIAGTQTGSVTSPVTQASIDLELTVSAGEKLKIVTLPTFGMEYGTTFGGATVKSKGSVKGVDTNQELVEKGSWSFADPTAAPEAGTTTASVTFTLSNPLVNGVTYERTITTDVSIDVDRKAITGTVSIGGDTAVGGILTSSAVGIIPAGAQSGLFYEWYKNDVKVASGAGVTTYTAAGASAGDMIQLKVTGTGNYTGTVASSKTEVGKIALSGAPTILHTTLTPGSILTASTGSIVPSSATLSYKWYVSGSAASIGSGDTYTLTKNELGKEVYLTAEGTGDYQGTVQSSMLSIPALAPDGMTASLAPGNASATGTWSANANGAPVTYYYKLTFKTPVVTTTFKIYTYETGSVPATDTAIVTDGATGYIFTTGGATYIDISGSGATSGASVYLVTGPAVAGSVTSGGVVTQATSGSITATSKVFSGLTNGVEYTLEVHAQNAIGTTAAVTAKATPVASTSGNRPGGGGGGGSAVTTKYTVTYDAGEHGTIAEKTEQVEKDKSPKGVKVTADEGWVFAGWSKDGKTVIDLKDIKVTGAMKLIAVYEKDDKIVIPDSVPDDLRFLQVSKGEISSGYVSGYTDGTFRPDNAITRAEVAAIVAKTINYEKEKGKSYTNTPFGDVARSEWYADDIGFVASLGVIAGYKDGTFKPNSNITRAEFVTMAMKIDRVVNSSKSFKDVSDADWYAEYVKSAAEKGYATGYLDGTFRPNNPITRAEAVTIINSIIGLEPSTGQMSFTDVPESHWAYNNIKAAAGK
ncbi:S-layer homology domain-containing protein [Bacilliculturomica massiliensis]|uniref:S-layer homology domain-containing protein n=1 Tax=Bacilliculturomica massiliensis TaxID=1917867 RepID=UPI0013EF5B46|nr:S-layer homology domain-containing protein [Bacilliculturomica massiliensis]